MGAYRDPGSLNPMTAATLAAILTTWVTFVPCFLWIFLGAPYVESLRSNRILAAALSSITAAVVGVIVNLSVWFAVHTIFRNVSQQVVGPIRVDLPAWRSLDLAALGLSIAALIAMLRFKLGMGRTLIASSIAGAAIWAAFVRT